MFKSIASLTERGYPFWASPRFKVLDIRDRLLDGTFYDILPYGFYDEVGGDGKPTSLKDRRPSVQARLPRMVSRWAARKLFAGRHAPRVQHPDTGTRKRIENLLVHAKFNLTMLDAVVRGSVGSVALTFRIEKTEGQQPNANIRVWEAKFCQPTFDTMGELANLRVAYVATGAQLADLAPGSGDLQPTGRYWFIRDYGSHREVTYLPEREAAWSPDGGFTEAGASLREWGEQVFDHALGFVPGVWIKMLTGGRGVDGACLWEDAITNSIELDYTMSQNGRGVRYNCAPQLVLIGDPVSDDESEEEGMPGSGGIRRSPMHSIQMRAGYKDADGNMFDAGDAKLLEMSGQGTEASQAYAEGIRKLTLELISAARKDPEKMKGPLSGRAMEYLDEDSHDLIMELRTSCGDEGALPLAKKIAQAALDADTSQMRLLWPRLYQISPQELQQMVAAFVQAMNPMAAPAFAPQGKPATPAVPPAGGPGAKPAGRPMGKPAQPAQPDPKPYTPPDEGALITQAEARMILRANLDLDLLALDADESDEQPDPDDGAGPAGTGIVDTTAPPPAPMDNEGGSGMQTVFENIDV